MSLRGLKRWIGVCDFDVYSSELVMRQCVAAELLSCLTGKADVCATFPTHRHKVNVPQVRYATISAESCKSEIDMTWSSSRKFYRAPSSFPTPFVNLL